jgi:hypothetical protein
LTTPTEGVGCATHSLPGKMPLEVEVRDPDGTLVASRKRV